MGTSKRRLNKTVTKMLEGKSVHTIRNEIQKITAVVLNEDVIKSYLNEEEVQTTLKVIDQKISTLKSAGYKGKTLEELEKEQITREEFLEEIISEIEKVTPIKSKLLKKALKIAMAEAIKDELDIYIFANLFFYHFIYLLLEQELFDSLRTVKDDLSSKQVKQILKQIADQIFKDKLISQIEKFIQKNISLSKVIGMIEKATQDIVLGEF
ncbi:hypothetical protein ETC01_16215 [Geobacillus sp. NFOSA3]|uniref:hypothetical protein n=1 Tax=Parageobacillus toebii TaxID=153151 RepID=UPI00149227F9|nr:hypothetical protein [Geobacillus sp. NFOSA3]